MNGTEIKKLRRQLGLTQNNLADAIHVDQGTVSRWERDIETPRPANHAGLEKLLVNSRTRSQNLLATHLKSNFYSAIWIGADGRIRDFSSKCREHYLSLFGLNVDSHIGMQFKQHCRILDRDEYYAHFDESCVLDGSITMLRIFLNVKGICSSNVYEPIFLEGEFAGVIGYLENRYQILENDEVSVEKVDAIYFKDLETSVVLFEGKYAVEMPPPPPHNRRNI